MDLAEWMGRPVYDDLDRPTADDLDQAREDRYGDFDPSDRIVPGEPALAGYAAIFAGRDPFQIV